VDVLEKISLPGVCPDCPPYNFIAENRDVARGWAERTRRRNPGVFFVSCPYANHTSFFTGNTKNVKHGEANKVPGTCLDAVAGCFPVPGTFALTL
jgi:hypothetical protein